MIKNLSVFFPTFNEEGNIEVTVKKATEVLKKLNLEYEILLIDDGSKDSTGEIADVLAKKDPHIRVIHHEKNLGYGEALKSGFYNAKYDTICYTDGDGQFDFSEISKFLEKIEDYDLILGYRIKRKDPFFRILFKKGWKLSLLTFFGMRFKDVDCGFKMIRKSVLEQIPHLESTRGAMINAELAIKTAKRGFRIGQVGVNHFPRLSGKPTGASMNVIVKSYYDLIRLWWKLKDEKWAFVILLGILFLAAFFRFYKLSEYMTFLGDEGRDALIVKRMLVDHHFPLIGPPTSVGNIYLGPFYYYMMAISMFFLWLNPVAASGMVAIIGVLTVYLIYFLGKLWFGRVAGLISAFLYSISPINIIHSRSSWNPNPAPFFSLLAIFGFIKARESNDFRWLIISGAAVGIAIQMHYLAIILIPVLATLWFYEFFKNRPVKNLIFGTTLGILAFMAVISPLIWFDLRHNFLNYRAVTQLLTQSDALGGNILGNFARIPVIFSYNLIGRYIGGENLALTIIISVFVILALFRKSWGIFYLGVWLLVGLFGVTFYQKDIYDHYLGFLNPVPYILIGSLINLSKNMLFKIIFTILLICVIFVNLQKNPILDPPNNQLGRTKQVANFIISQAENKPFNFALLAQRNYDAAYQFYLDMCGYKPKQVPFEITDQLFVVCEDQVCEPVNNPKYEIAAFGWLKIDKQWDAYGVKIYKLEHNPSGKP